MFLKLWKSIQIDSAPCFLFVLMLPILALSCYNNEKTTEYLPPKEVPSYMKVNSEYINQLSPEQEEALSIFNTLQVSTDTPNQLYSTFAGLNHSCYPPDSVFTISQSEFLGAMTIFLEKHCKQLTSRELDTLLAEKSVLAQEKYTVLWCSENSNLNSPSNESMQIGSWIIPNLLGRRDLIIVW